jgi:hypothetical protein
VAPTGRANRRSMVKPLHAKIIELTLESDILEDGR